VSWRYSSRSYALHKESEFKKLSKAEKNKFVKKPQLWGKHPRKWEKSV
jgi:predicted GIY-YIG superfamily endonuclease